MKTIVAQSIFFLRQSGAKRNIRSLLRFMLLLGGLVVAYSIAFHYVMLWEGQRHSWVTGFYWTLTVMSTLGFGDITFSTDLGRVFSIVVLTTGVIFLLTLLPFTLIQFFYAPWVEAQNEAATPRHVAPETRDHVILTRHDPVTAALIRKFDQFGHQYVIIVPDGETALRLQDMDLDVVVGDADDPDTWQRAGVNDAVLVATTHDEVINTNIAFTVRQVDERVPIVATSTAKTSLDILHRAGATNIMQLGEMMGKALARCMVGGDALTHVVDHVDELLIAEANAHRTPLVGKTLRENRLNELGVNVIGLWDRGVFQYATPDTVVNDHSILFLAGSAAHFAAYDEDFMIYNVSVKPVVILGSGRVGKAAARAFAARGIDYRIVDLDPSRFHDPAHGIVGDARDPEVLHQAGLDDAPAVLVTTHDDSLNIYLTIYCRSLRSDIQIISRSTLERHIETLHRAGADFVLSYASMGANAIFNLIKRGRITTVAEGLNILRLKVPPSLDGRTILNSDVRNLSGCTIVALRNSQDELIINPPPSEIMHVDREMILVGSVDSEAKFIEHFVDP